MKVEFTGPLWVVDWEEAGAWVLLQDLTATVTNDDDTTVEVVARSGFITDFCSVPRLPFVYDVLGNIARKSGCLHDWLYKEAVRPRQWCDDALRAALIAQGVAEWKVQMMYVAVRTLGEANYGAKQIGS